MEEVRERLNRRSWNFIFQRRKDRKKYIDLYKRKKPVKWLKPLKDPEKKTLEKLEEDLPYEDIIL